MSDKQRRNTAPPAAADKARGGVVMPSATGEMPRSGGWLQRLASWADRHPHQHQHHMGGWMFGH